MRKAGTTLLVALAIGCTPDAGDEPQAIDSGAPSGACGDVTLFDVTLRGRVEDGTGAPVGNALVTLEERNWDPGEVHGQVRADASGRFELQGHRLPMVEDCWGTAVQLWLVGEAGDLWGDKPMNDPIGDSLDAGTGAPVDLQFPLILR